MAVALTRDLGHFVAHLRYRDIPQEALATIRTGFADCVGVMLAGALQPAPRILEETLAPVGNEAILWSGAGRASAMDAAWINGTAAHALDFDDVALRGHPSVVLVPAILAEAEAVGASGQDMMRAYAAGYETWAELVRRDPDHQHKKGWHPTGVFGAVAAAAACAALRGLNAEKAATAIALGASQSAGLMSNLGTMAKPFHGGRAAHAGVLAGRLADRGFTASLDALEHPPGYLTAISVANRIDTDSPTEAGVHWKIVRHGLSVKKYPVCFASHCAIDGMFDVLQREAVSAQDVRRVVVSLNHRHVAVMRNHLPQNALAAKFSMEFSMACPLIARRVGFRELTDEFVRRPDVQALMQRVEVTAVDEDPQRPGFSVDDRVVIETTGGGRFDSGRLMQIRGSPNVPLTRDDLWQKFDDCARYGESRFPIRALFDCMMDLEQLQHVSDLPGLKEMPGVQ